MPIDPKHVLRKVEAGPGLADLVLPSATRSGLETLCANYGKQREMIVSFGRRRFMPLPGGLRALFAGGGENRLRAAGAVAAELGLPLFAVDVSAVSSKYIGETEKNLERVFAAADRAPSVLLFDEADALFGKRTGVRDSHDRYANTEISFLLQRLESRSEGIAIVAINRRSKFDSAFVRRFHHAIDFSVTD